MPRARAAACLVAVAVVIPSSRAALGRATAGYVRVRAIEDRVYGRVAYRYVIENNSRAQSIVAFRIGEDAARSRAELPRPPYGWTDEKGLPIGSALAPDGWTVEAVREDDADRWVVEWFASDADEAIDIAPGEMRDGFSLIVFDSAPEYVLGHWTVVFSNGQRVSGQLERDEP
jgi:hypothetical protein